MASNEIFFSGNRENYILYLLGKRGRMTIAELCDIFGTAPSTMRRILNNMEKNGLVIRTHGGAASIDARQEEPLERKVILNVEQKKAIAAKARSLIKDGETIALGDGSTVLELCYLLKNLKNSIVLTDSIPAANVLMNYKNIEVRICKGIIQGRIGHIADLDPDDLFDDIHINKAIIGADSINIESGIGNSNILVSQAERKMLSCADEKIVLCDYSKIGKNVLFPLVPLEEIDCLITDDAVNPQFVKEARERGLKVLIAKTSSY